MYVMFGELDCMLRVFDPGRLLVVRVGNLKRINQRVKGVRPRPLTCVRVGNLNELTNELRVFDPGR